MWHNPVLGGKVNVSQHALIVGTDREACDAASASVPCVVGDGGLFGALRSRSGSRRPTREYARLMHVKARPCLMALKLGFDVIYTDTDIVWTRNPLRELRRPRRRRRTEGSDWDGGGGGGALRDGDLGAAMSSADVLIQSDYDESNEAPCRAHSECARSTRCDLPSSRCEARASGGLLLRRTREQGG